MKRILIFFMLIACIAKVSAQNSDSQVTGGITTDDILQRIGPQYMPTDIESIKAPFDVSGIKRPVFANRTTTVKMKRKGLSTLQIQKAIDRMSEKGGGTVIIPDGQWTSGRIELKSGVQLHLSDGAVLTFSGDIKDYLPVVQTRNEGYDHDVTWCNDLCQWSREYRNNRKRTYRWSLNRLRDICS